MKHLLNGVAIAAALAIAAPVWAQAPMTPASPSAPRAAPPAAPSAAEPMAPKASKASKKRAKGKMAKAGKKGGKMARAGKGGGDNMTDQLNREELARIQGGAPMTAPAPGAGMTPAMQGPRSGPMKH